VCASWYGFGVASGLSGWGFRCCESSPDCRVLSGTVIELVLDNSGSTAMPLMEILRSGMELVLVCME
jgi:hypothetical protein